MAKKSEAVKRAYSVNNVLNAKFKGLDFEGVWLDLIGKPAMGKSWIIWGQSGSGKTTFNMMLAKYLSKFERVIYNSLEEGLSKSIQNAYNRAGLTEKHNVLLIEESMEDLTRRLHRKKSPNVVFIDSLRYTRLRTWEDYRRFCDIFSNKILIWVGHAQGKEPKGNLAKDVRYDSMVKIYVEGFRAFATSRYSVSTGSYMDIWSEGARDYYGF